MAFVLTPRFAPAYQAPQCSPFGFCGPVSRPSYAYRVSRPRPQRPQYSSFSHFFNQVDELLGEIDRESQRQAQIEAQREAHRQRQQRKRALRARFAVNQTEQGWQVNGEFEGFTQENISIEVTDENTVKIAGNTHWQAEKVADSQTISQDFETPAITQAADNQPSNDEEAGVQVSEPDFENVTEADTATVGATTPDSDTESHKSYQATVEDDFEDLGAETSSLVSSPSRPSSPAAPTEPKGKEKVVEEPAATEANVPQESQVNADAPVNQAQPQQDEKAHGSFERTFRFPERIDASRISANFKDGILSVTVPRAPAQQVRRIAIL